jgi:nicotinamidase-related amidase
MRINEYVTPKNIDAKTAKWLGQVRRSVAPRPHLVLAPERAVLLVVDMLNYFASPHGAAFLPATAAIVPRIASILEAFRNNGNRVIFTRHCHEGEHTLGMLGRFFLDYIRAGEPEAEIIAPLAPRDDELVIPKTTYDAFLGTNLQQILEQNKIEQVLVTGVLTHMCCETTARSAFCRGFEVYIPADATASNSEEHHLASLLSMADCVATVIDSKEGI